MRDPSTTHGIAITHFCVTQRQGVKNCSVSSVMCGPNDNALCNGSEEDGAIRSECEEDESTDCQVGTLTLTSKGS